MKNTFFSASGNRYHVEHYSIIEKEYANKSREGKTWVSVYVNGYYAGEKHLSVYYRHERTWDDHMGNTPCGYYVRLPLGNGKTRRVYLFQ